MSDEQYEFESSRLSTCFYQTVEYKKLNQLMQSIDHERNRFPDLAKSVFYRVDRASTYMQNKNINAMSPILTYQVENGEPYNSHPDQIA